jgi:hypothetical protein
MSKSEVLSALEVIGPMTRPELDKYLGLKRSAVGASLRYLREDNLVCIVDWTPPAWACAQAPIYGLGKEDKPRPPVRTRAEVQRIWRAAQPARVKAKRNQRPAGFWDQLL